MKTEEYADGPYADIINLEHPVSRKHSPMPAEDRAAQFSPFAALTGFEDVIDDVVTVKNEKF